MAIVSACIVPVYNDGRCSLSGPYTVLVYLPYTVRVYALCGQLVQVRAIVTGYTSMIMLYSDGRAAYQAGERGEQSFDLEPGNACSDTDSPILIKSTCNPVSHPYLQSFSWLLGAFSNFKNKIRLQKCVVENTGQPI